MQGTHVAYWNVSRTLFLSRVACLTELARQLPISAPELWEGERGWPRSRSFEHATQGTHIGSFHALCSHEWLA